MESKIIFSKAVRYDDYKDYFRLKGNCNMKLSGKAAKDLCIHAADHGLLIWRVEGGITRENGFEVRLDCIWDNPDCVMKKEEACECNKDALEFIEEMENDLHYDFFMILSRKYNEKYKIKQ